MAKHHTLSNLVATSALLLASCSYDLSKAEAEEDFIYSDEIIYPIEEGSDLTLSGSIYYQGTQKHESIFGLAHFYHYVNGQYELYRYMTVIKPFILYPNTSISYSFDVYMANVYAKDGILIELDLADPQNSSHKYASKTLKVSTYLNEVINVDDYRTSFLNINRLSKQNGEEISEIFMFDEIPNHELIPYYWRFDISSYNFFYVSSLPFTMEQAYLSFVDTNNLFPSIPLEEDGTKILHLSYKQVYQRVYLEFRPLFVSPITLDISRGLKIGYQKTNYLFFPRNKQTELQGYTFTINMLNMGANGIAVHHEVMLNTSKLLIGPCNDSTFCIVGGKA